MGYFWSRLKGFHTLSILERRKRVLSLPLSVFSEDFENLDGNLAEKLVDTMSENVVGKFSWPFSVAPNFLINGENLLVPMCTEEPSIVAGASKIAKMVSLSGGFFSEGAEPVNKGQVQIYGFSSPKEATLLFQEYRLKLLEIMRINSQKMAARGGGVLDLKHRLLLDTKIGPMLILEPIIDVRDAMGANFINSMCELLAKEASRVFPYKIGIAILSNYCSERIATASCEIPIKFFNDEIEGFSGLDVAERIYATHAFAEADLYRAATHNKGIMNGIDALAVATGNDFRALEAGAYTFLRDNNLNVLTQLDLKTNKEVLHAQIRLPVAVGVVGGSCNIHPGVKLTHKLLGKFSQSSKSLSMVFASLGLAQCLSALLALSTHGIQRGHMKLHNKKKKISE